MDVENIGRFLLKLRKENNLTQKEIATLCNVSAQAVSKWERGMSVPDIELLERLSVLYRISINEIIMGEKKTIYIDIEKRKRIIDLTASIFVFLAYLFNFVNFDVYGMGFNNVLKGYQLIFNGTSGIAVVLSWLVFIILISFLIIRIYLITKILDYTSLLHKYLKNSMLLVMFVSAVLVIAPGFYVFPQIIIFLSVLVQYINTQGNDYKNSEEDEKMLKYSISYKAKDIDENLLLEKKYRNLKLIRLSKALTVIGVFSSYAISLIFLSEPLYILSNQLQGDNMLILIVTMTSFIIVLATYTLKSYKLIGSFITKKVLIKLGIVFAVIPVFMSTMMELSLYLFSSEIISTLSMIIFTYSLLTSIILFVTAYKIKEKIKW